MGRVGPLQRCHQKSVSHREWNLVRKTKFPKYKEFIKKSPKHFTPRDTEVKATHSVHQAAQKGGKEYFNELIKRYR